MQQKILVRWKVLLWNQNVLQMKVLGSEYAYRMLSIFPKMSMYMLINVMLIKKMSFEPNEVSTLNIPLNWIRFIMKARQNFSKIDGKWRQNDDSWTLFPALSLFLTINPFETSEIFYTTRKLKKRSNINVITHYAWFLCKTKNLRWWLLKKPLLNVVQNSTHFLH